MGSVQEIKGAFTDIMAITELRGSYPNVPIAPDVDYSSLTANDPDPMFLTLPIGKAGSKSGNQRFYDEAWLQELERQVMQNRPIGLMGHLSPDERATAFPPEAVHWVGVMREQDMLWGKGYVPPGPVRDRIRRYKAQGKTIATSIDAYAEGVWNEQIKAFHMQANTLKLAQIDIAPADRAGLPDLAAVPHLTTEMADDAPQGEEDITVDKLQVIREMTPEDAQLLPAAVRDAVLATAQPAPEVAQVAGIREALGLDANADPVQAITEMRRTQAEQAKQMVTNRITELVTEGVKAEAMRPLVTELVTARNPQTVQEAEAVTKQVLESEAVTKLLAAHVQETMGPAQRTQVQGQNGQAKYFQIPKDE